MSMKSCVTSSLADPKATAEHTFTPTFRYPVSAKPDEQLFVALNFNVMSNGRVRQVEVMDSNIPLREVKQKLTDPHTAYCLNRQIRPGSLSAGSPAPYMPHCPVAKNRYR